MAKSSKLEDYWREHNIENIFKELTQILVRRMPSDPILLIVEHLQKKFPKSFKTSTGNNINISKTLPTDIKLQAISLASSDIQNESLSDEQRERRLSNQSQVSGIVTIPTVGSAFTDLLKQDTRHTQQQGPLSDIKNFVFASHLARQGIKKGKDIRSDRDILDEEVIKPIKTTSKSDVQNQEIVENLENIQTHEEPSVRQLIKYKQRIRLENDRRLHREKLAELANVQREKEQISQADLVTKPEEMERHQTLDVNDLSTKKIHEKSDSTRTAYKPIANSKEEEEILNDETMFQCRQNRRRDRQRFSNMPERKRRNMMNFRSTMRKSDENLVCKFCGHPVDENRPISPSSTPTEHSMTSKPVLESVETANENIDDWFDSASVVSGTREMSPWRPEDEINSTKGSTTFRRNLFQPIKDNVQHRPPIHRLSSADDEKHSKNTDISELFARSPELKIRRPSSSRSVPSPTQKKSLTDTLRNTMMHLSSSKQVPTKSTTIENTNRRESGWNLNEDSPDINYEN